MKDLQVCNLLLRDDKLVLRRWKTKKKRKCSFVSYICWKTLKAQHRIRLQYSQLQQKKIDFFFWNRSRCFRALFMWCTHKWGLSRPAFIILLSVLSSSSCAVSQAEQKIPPVLFSIASGEKPALSHNLPVVYRLLNTTTCRHCALLWCICSRNTRFPLHG